MSGSFRKLLTDLIKDIHNSNLQLRQITLAGEIIEEEKFHVLGFVSADTVNLKKDLWFGRLDSQQTSNVEETLNRRTVGFA